MPPSIAAVARHRQRKQSTVEGHYVAINLLAGAVGDDDSLAFVEWCVGVLTMCCTLQTYCLCRQLQRHTIHRRGCDPSSSEDEISGHGNGRQGWFLEASKGGGG